MFSNRYNCSATGTVSLAWTTGSPESTASTYYEEHYAVYVVTDPTQVLAGIFPAPVFETTLSAGGTLFNEFIDISALAGNQAAVYVIFRHFGCFDENYMILDNVVVDVNLTDPCANFSASSTTTDETGFGANDGSMTVSQSGGSGSYTYSWSPNTGNFAPTVTGLAPGNYSVSVTDWNTGCVATTSGTIVAAGPCSGFDVAVSTTNETTPGGNDGTATTVVSNGTAPFSYSWSPSGGSAASASGLTPNTYVVTVTDANSCVTTGANNVIPMVCTLSATTSSTNVSSPGGTNGSASVNAAGGSAPYSYSWSPSGGSQASATGLAPGTYTTTITDNNNCTISVVTVVNDFGCGLSTPATSTNETSFGANDGTASVTVSGGTAPYTYSWSPTGGTNSSTSGLTPGTYTVVVTESNGCSSASTVTITNSPFVSVPTIVNVEANAYPNPANDVLNIEMSKNMSTVSIITMNGKVISTASVNSTEAVINVSNLNAGMYFYVLTSEKGHVVRNSFTKQ